MNLDLYSKYYRYYLDEYSKVSNKLLEKGLHYSKKRVLEARVSQIAEFISILHDIFALSKNKKRMDNQIEVLKGM